MTNKFTCADCGASKVVTARTLRRVIDIARDDGWAISRDYSKQWCPTCAIIHRNTGRNGKREV